VSNTLLLDPNADDQKLLAKVVAYYHDTLKKNSAARKYLTSRSITHPSVIDHFRIGFSDRSLGTKLPSKDCRSRFQRGPFSRFEASQRELPGEVE
jgi:DNA primase